MAETVQATDGTMLPLSNLAQTFAYSGSFISTITVQYPAVQTGVLTTYTQTFTNNGTNITGISQWVPS